MAASAYPRRPEYLQELRQESRWIDGRIALSRVGEVEFLGMTGDVSLSGLRLALVGAVLAPESDIRVDVAYEGSLLAFRGRIRYAVSKPWGCIVGVHCAEHDVATREFLSGRYGS